MPGGVRRAASAASPASAHPRRPVTAMWPLVVTSTVEVTTRGHVSGSCGRPRRRESVLGHGDPVREEPSITRTTAGHRVETPQGRSSRTTLRNRGALSPTQGILLEKARSPLDVARAVLSVLPPDTVVSHTSAARLLNLPLPERWSPLEPVHVTVRPPRRAPRRRGVIGHKADTLIATSVDGVPCTSLAVTWAQLAGMLSFPDLVAVTDAVLGRECRVQGLVTPELLATVMPRGARGAASARDALLRADGGAASRKETQLRLLVASWGVPTPCVNADIFDEVGGWVATCDLVWFEQKVALEYEGDHHRTNRRQWQHDIERIRLLESLGWDVKRATSQDLRRPARLREALLAALNR